MQIDAPTLATPDAIDRVRPLLERLAQRGETLFVHSDDTGALASSWYAWSLHGRAQHPTLRIVFAELAGLAPLHAERLIARVPGAPVMAAVSDPLTFYDTASCGALAVDAMALAVGSDALVSDRAYVERPAAVAA